MRTDVVIVGGGPGGLSAAETIARGQVEVMVLEQDSEIGSPIRTSGGSFIKELQALGIPERLYHPIKRGRFLSPNNSVTFEYEEPVACVMDVRRVFQYLAEKAVKAGAQLRVNTTALEPVMEGDYVVGVKARDFRGQELVIESKIVIDASGYKASMSKKAGLHKGFKRFGVGAEYDLYAPHYDQDESVLIVGSKVAPAGYAWAFPWGGKRVRVGAGIIHADSKADPSQYLEKLVHHSPEFELNLEEAEPLEYHFGLIPSDGLCDRFVGNGIMAVGDAAGQPSALVGEGIRWAIKAGRMAGEVAVEAVRAKEYSIAFLEKYQNIWKERYGTRLDITFQINQLIAGYGDLQWDKAVDLLKRLSPELFAEALQANFTPEWVSRVIAHDPAILDMVMDKEIDLWGIAATE